MYYYYDSDEFSRSRSPPLKAVKPRATPSPSPPPTVTHTTVCYSSRSRNVTSHPSRKVKKPNRRKTQPSIGDSVLIRQMDPNRPDIARLVGERALNSDSASGSETDDEDMEERSQTTEPPTSESAQTESSTPPVDHHILQNTAQKALETNVVGSTTNRFPPPFPRKSRLEIDTRSPGTLAANTDTRPSQSSNVVPQSSNTRLLPEGHDSKTPANSSAQSAATSERLTEEHSGQPANDSLRHDSIATSPKLRELAIPPSRGALSEKLPALQNPQSPSRDGPPGSPNQERRLPSFRHLNELAETAMNEQETSRVNGYPHRQSVSSSIAQSPTSGARHLSISSQFPPLSASSPSSGNSDIFLRAGQHLTLFSTRRPSQASDNGLYSGTIHSASTNESYQSSDGLSPGTQATPTEGRGHRMSIDGALTNRTLPIPVGTNIQLVPPHGSGGFKCDYNGCTAAPFQTQYLLNSHANVHSQSRPHYCPVASCPRGEGGKGFKRKNEMIRHGLVHASPGYVCPFCPDREHKYPRPDNLQRHVRVHHVDKDKDDPQLRDVLAQRPEGGSRGRRRRAS
ncbi:hypothetical protein K504DRAFT_278782 [Pleomassaria siparia CBS 279.74]|uniref:C2H2-type domain-containing protein n=1 Tax=Pleomassaria siparia CBS 279.74 TaxID=1314801 RepID=A0A6G1K9Z8_9PLEO|nr:hypothetical protein K504DRAFT_278782 [Pleomassaria siparia CBS 279.74]